jgi:hypothetical protein
MTASVALHRQVVLLRDLPAEGLKQGDLGTVVHVYPSHASSGDASAAQGYEVEFFTATGKTRVVQTLRADHVRSVGDRDVITVRSLDRAG